MSTGEKLREAGGYESLFIQLTASLWIIAGISAGAFDLASSFNGASAGFLSCAHPMAIRMTPNFPAILVMGVLCALQDSISGRE